jgi:hypothetical protein
VLLGDIASLLVILSMLYLLGHAGESFIKIIGQ